MDSEYVHVPIRVFISISKKSINEWYVMLAKFKSVKDQTIYECFDKACEKLGLHKAEKNNDLILKDLSHFKIKNKKKLLLAKLRYSF